MQSGGMMDKKITVNLSEICAAMEDNSGEVNYFLDLHTGEVLSVSDYVDDQEEIVKKIEEEPDRYKGIPTISSSEAFQIMEDFIETVQDDEIRDALYDAIDGRKPFYHFKETISDYPEEELRWYDFKENVIRNWAREWLRENGVEFIEEDRKPDWLEKEIKKKQEEIHKSIEVFTEGSSRIEGILEIGLFGSITTTKRKLVRDIDFYVIIENTDCIDSLAKLYRKVYGTYHQSLDVSIFTKDKKFLGNICFRKECPTNSIDCQVPDCGKTKYIRRFFKFDITMNDILKSNPKVLWQKK